jgi:YbbR domain-containing protein
MSKVNRQEWAGGVKLLSLVLAGLLWLSVALEHSGQMKVSVPVTTENLPAGLRLDAPLPRTLQVTLSGPRIVLCRLWLSQPTCKLDLSSAVAGGTAGYAALEASLGLDRELKVVSITPASINLALVKQTQDR